MLDSLSYLLLNSTLLISVCALVFFLVGLWLGRLLWAGDRTEAARISAELDTARESLADTRRKLLTAEGDSQSAAAELADCRQRLAEEAEARTDRSVLPEHPLVPDEVDDLVARLRRELDKTGSELEIARAEKMQLGEQLDQARRESARLRAVVPRSAVRRPEPAPIQDRNTVAPSPAASAKADAVRPGGNGSELPEPWSAFAEQLDNGDARLDDHLGVLFDRPPVAADDLTRIKGIATVLNGKLNDFGIYTYRQIAGWDDAAAAEMSKRLAFKDRVQRDDWIGQAKVLHTEKYGEALD